MSTQKGKAAKGKGKAKATEPNFVEHKHEKQIGTVNFSVDKRYTPLRVIGTGAYGVVCEALDNQSGKKIAIKKIPQAFEILTIAKRTLLEVKLLKHFHQHDNIITLLDVMRPPKPPSPFNDVYVVMDLQESDLHRIIHSQQPLTEEHIRYFTYQLCRGLKYIHSANVLHRDIKPGNLLLTSTCDLKICDFGMARGLTSKPEEHTSFMTAYVATRWYRAPEIMLSFKEYTQAIDVWSVGCILGEMLGRKYLFAGTNYVNQLNLILNTLGTPTEELIVQIGSVKARQYLRSLKPKGPIPFKKLYPNASDEATDFLSKLLLFDPKKRMSMTEALAHPFLARYHNPRDEPTCSPFDFAFEKKEFTAAELKHALLKEIQDFFPSFQTRNRQPSSAPLGGTKPQQQPAVKLIKHGKEPATNSGGGGCGSIPIGIPPQPQQPQPGKGKRKSTTMAPAVSSYPPSQQDPLQGTAGLPPFPGMKSDPLQQSLDVPVDIPLFSTDMSDSRKRPRFQGSDPVQGGAIGSTLPDLPLLPSGPLSGIPPLSGLPSGLLSPLVTPILNPDDPSTNNDPISVSAIATDLKSLDDSQWLDKIDPTWLQPTSNQHTELQNELELGCPDIFY